jgi:hypothetical protein
MGLVRTFVPVPRVVWIPFSAMQVGMDPSRLLPRLFVLGDVVSAVKISLGIPPKSLQQRGQTCRGGSLAQRSTEFFDRHGGILRLLGLEGIWFYEQSLQNPRLN